MGTEPGVAALGHHIPRTASPLMHLDAIAANLPDAVVVVDAVGTVVWLNPAAERFFGWPASEWLGRSALDLVHPDDLGVTLSSLELVRDKDVGTYVELRVLTSHGWRLAEVIGAGRSTDPEIGGVILTLRDLTERRRWEVARSDDERFRALVQHGPAITMLVDLDGIIESVSGAITRVLGHDPSVITGTPLLDLALPAARDRLAELLATWQRPETMRLTRVETRFRHHTNRAGVPVEIAVADLSDDPIVRGMVLSVQDITDLVEAREVASRLVRLDGLTGLPNRSVLTQHLAEGVEAVHAGTGTLTVGFVDLDRFKPVNDLLGHEVGDHVLRGVAVRLLGAVRPEELVARYGGDEFVVVSTSADPEHLAARLDDALRLPLRIGERSIQVAASVGAVAATPDDTPESVLTEADAAMVRVKRARQGRFPTNPLPIGTRRTLATALTRGIATREIVLHFQPIVEIPSGRVVGAEALVRWQHPERGLLMPADFLGLAEEAGLDTTLGAAVLDQACAAMAALEAEGQSLGRLAVNLSAAQLLDPDLPHMVRANLDRHGIDPNRLCLEVTERAVPEGGHEGPAATAIGSLRRLAGLGVHIAIDDFGTGGSTLTHLVSLPAHQLKIDRSFVAGLGDAPSHRAVVAGVVGMGRAMGLDVVAEGVEDDETRRALVELGCTHAQGYLFGKPCPLDAFRRSLANA
jgi:diguanylate cyclase (GGDEF)-like protein/PAS domain S-box-containing protein